MQASEALPQRRVVRFSVGALWGALHALFLVLAFPPLPRIDALLPESGLPAFVFIAIAPLAFASRKLGASKRRWFLLGILVGAIPFSLSQHLWVFAISDLGAPFLIAILSAYPAIFVGLFGWWQQRVGPSRLILHCITGGVLWAALEMLRGFILFDGYPWHFIGQPLVELHPLSGAGALIGLSGVSLLAALASSSLGMAQRPRRGLLPPAISLACVLTLFGIGVLSHRHAPAPGSNVRIGVLQTNVPQSVRGAWEVDRRYEDFERFINASSAMVYDNAVDLIVWPETMFPGPSLEPTYLDAMSDWLFSRSIQPDTSFHVGLARSLLSFQEQVDTPMLIGAQAMVDPVISLDADGEYLEYGDAELFNSMFALQSGSVTGRYDKMHLVPFGEVMPYISAWPWLESKLLSIAARGMSFNLDAAPDGAALSVMIDSEPLRVATPICFEATNPNVVRKLSVNGNGLRAAQLLLHPTNDGWFGTFDHGRKLHEQIFRWRCIEFGTPGVRVANTGMSGAYDSFGQQISAVFDGRPVNARAFGTVVFDVPPAIGPIPLGAQLERWIRIGSLVGLAGIIGIGLVLGHSNRKEAMENV